MQFQGKLLLHWEKLNTNVPALGQILHVSAFSAKLYWFTYHSSVGRWNNTTVKRDEAAAQKGLEKGKYYCILLIETQKSCVNGEIVLRKAYIVK